MAAVPGAPRSRTATYSALAGLMAGVLVTGLVVPFVFGERVSDIGSGAQDELTLDGSAAGSPGGVAGPDTGEAPRSPLSGALGGPSALPGAPAESGANNPPGAASGPDTSGGAPGTGAGAAPAAQPGTTGGEARRASAVGVTASTVKIGFIVPDLSTLETLGYPVNNGDGPGQVRAFIDDLNRRGGVQGRKVEAVVARTDVVDQNKMRETCRRLTVDEKVFAVLGTVGFYGPPVLCIAQEQKVPFLMVDGVTKEWSTKLAPNRLFTVNQNKTRVMQNYADFAARSGALKGKKVGLLKLAGFDSEPVDKGLKPVLKQLGVTVTSEFTFSQNPDEASGQMPVAVNQMRRDGVEVILNGLNFIYNTQFVTTADGQGYRPRYVFSEFAQGTANFHTLRMPASFDGTIGTQASRDAEAVAGGPQPAVDKACQGTYEKASGRRLNRSSNSSTEYAHTMNVCTVTDMFARALNGAGVNPTRDTYGAAMGRLGNLPLAHAAGGSFTPGKADANDFLRPVVWRNSCKCWQPVQNTAFARTRY